MPISNMIYRESKNGHLKEEKVVRISLNKAIVILITAILGSAGASIWGTLAVANTIPFRVSAVEKQVADFKTQYMPLDLSLEKWKNNDATHATMEIKLSRIEDKIDEITKEIKRVE